jgi:hypothetical protein
VIRLGAINRVLEWTGFVLVVSVDVDEGPDREPTRIGLVFVGWPPRQAWLRHCERSRMRKAVRP